MQVIARRVGLCCHLVRDAEKGAKTIIVGKRHREPIGTWTLYRDREPIGEVTVVGCVRRRGAGAVLSLAEPLAVDLEPGMELGDRLLSRRRLHDLRHSSASIQLAEGVAIELVSKRLGHASPAITGRLYAHLLRSAGQAAARTVADAVPRRAVRPRAHSVPTTIMEGKSGQSETPTLQVGGLILSGPSGTRTLNSPVKSRPGGVSANAGSCRKWCLTSAFHVA